LIAEENELSGRPGAKVRQALPQVSLPDRPRRAP